MSEKNMGNYQIGNFLYHFYKFYLLFRNQPHIINPSFTYVLVQSSVFSFYTFF